jgi:hypothetical protein
MKFTALFWMVVFFVSVAVEFISCAYLYSQRPEKKRRRVAVLGAIAMALVMFSTLGMMLNMPADGMVITNLSQDATYTTEWFSTDGPAVVMKLRVGDIKQGCYYEIPKYKIIFWGKEENKLPAKFKVLTDKTGEFYALKSVE